MAGGGHLSGPTVASRLKRPTRWQSPPVSGLTLGPSNQLLGLAGGGVFPASDVTIAAVRSYRTISPLLVPIARDVSRVFSVALSLGLPPVAVSHHRALPCPDFPPRTRRCGATTRPTHLIDYLLMIICQRTTNYYSKSLDLFPVFSVLFQHVF